MSVLPRNDTDAILRGLPAWARALAALGAVGILGVIAIWLVWVGGNTLPDLNKQMIVVNQQNQRIIELLLEDQKTSEELYRIMQRICAATARTPEIRDGCFDR